MAAYGAGDQLTGQTTTFKSPNFVGELFTLSPLETPFLALAGGLTGGESLDGNVEFTWQDTLHRAPALQSVAEGADTTNFTAQKRNVRRNVVAIHQYGVEISYTKEAGTGILGSGGLSPTIPAPSILGTQPVQSEMGWQTQIKIEQAALDVELMFLTGTYAYPNAGQARQTQGILGWVSAATTTATTGSVPASSTVVNDIAQKLWLEGAPMQSMIIMLGSRNKVELGQSYSVSATGTWNLQPRDRSVFGVNITDIVTEFGTFGLVLNRHLDPNVLLFAEMSLVAPKFLAIPGKGHFFLEEIAKSGAYDRKQLYGEIGLKLGPAGWHGKATNLHLA